LHLATKKSDWFSLNTFELFDVCFALEAFEIELPFYKKKKENDGSILPLFIILHQATN